MPPPTTHNGAGEEEIPENPKQYTQLFTHQGAGIIISAHAHHKRALRACFSDHTGVFTDAVMSVKSAHPYCQLVLGASKTSIFTDAVGS